MYFCGSHVKPENPGLPWILKKRIAGESGFSPALRGTSAVLAVTARICPVNQHCWLARPFLYRVILNIGERLFYGRQRVEWSLILSIARLMAGSATGANFTLVIISEDAIGQRCERRFRLADAPPLATTTSCLTIAVTPHPCCCNKIREGY